MSKKMLMNSARCASFTAHSARCGSSERIGKKSGDCRLGRPKCFFARALSYAPYFALASRVQGGLFPALRRQDTFGIASTKLPCGVHGRERGLRTAADVDAA